MKTNITMAGGIFMLAVAVGMAALPVEAQTISQLEARLTALEKEAAETSSATPPITSVLGFDLEFYGYAQGEAQFDNNYDLGLNGGGIAGITPSTEEDAHSRVHGYESRLGVRGTQNTEVGKLTFNIEGDFYGSGGGSFRLRHSYGMWEGNRSGLLAGQTWSVFSKAESAGGPSPLDFNGVFGSTSPRVGQIRYTYKFSDEIKGMVSVEEDNESSIANRVAFAGALKWASGTSSASISVLSRQIEWAGGNTNGWGVNIGGQLAPWEGGLLQATVTKGKAITSFLKGSGYATLLPTAYYASDLDAKGDGIESTSVAAGLTHAISDKLEIGAIYGFQKYDEGAGTPSTGMEKVSSAHITIRYKPTENILMGLEYIKSEKSLYDGTDFDNDRFLGITRFTF